MPQSSKVTSTRKGPPPSVLVVDDEQETLGVICDVVGRELGCNLVCARDVSEARAIIDRQSVELLVTDMHLPDGDGTSLIASLQQKQPTAGVIVIAGEPTVATAISALRAGAADFIPKPLSPVQLLERVNSALDRQRAHAKAERRLDRLRDAVRRLNTSRRLVTRKVDLLCNDLVSAYGELSRQLDDVRNQESFRKLLRESNDLEQMLCHAMDWILRKAGYCNVAIWLAADTDEFQLGAYMKYTIAGEPQVTDTMRDGVVQQTLKQGFVHLTAENAHTVLTAAELKHLADQTIITTNCTYLGESLAVVALFRDDRAPFSAEDVTMLKAVAPVFATSLAGMVRRGESDDAPDSEDEHDDSGDTETDDRKKERRSEADWWKRGEPPPY